MADPNESALHRLRSAVLPVLDEASERERRERIARRVMVVQRELSRRRELTRRWALGVAVAALIGGAGALLLVLGPDASLPRHVASAQHGERVRLVAGHASLRDGPSLASLAEGEVALRGDSVLVTRAEESAELRLASDTALSVAPATEVGIERELPRSGGFEERVRLRSGSVTLKVPKLGGRGKVSVETRDAVVEVHGTQFAVRVVQRPPLEPFTEVQVREGRVAVRSGAHEALLGAGEHWSSRDIDAKAWAAAPSTSPPAPAIAPPVRSPPRSNSIPGPRMTASELAAQNSLLEAAELAQKSGMPALALQRLDALIQRYPEADLAHNARVERFRLLSRMGRRSEAAAAARAYLDRHPSGFARREAQLLLAERSTP